MVVTGLERLVQQQVSPLSDRKIGLLCHHASFTSDLIFAADTLTQAGGRIERLLGPEHGPWGTAQDMIPVGGGKDRWTGMEVVSLYGDNKQSLRPDPCVFEGLDLLVIDLQDVGARYYTYACTAAFAAEVAAEAGVEVILCDRPNPIGGLAMEGNLLQPDCASFVGMFPVLQRHGLTIAELVLATTDCEITVIPMDGWRRDMWFDQSGLPWIPPSPNMPSLTTAALYPGLCLLEGTTLSEGRGTTTPFEVFGAPFVEPFVLAKALNELNLPGVMARPHVFEPTFQKHALEECGGVQLIITD
ncbi:MAG TPA: DUF1343 domain-containing protein, partial [Myxococcales bacterium]|nr:DUF1343 domain-containing protein [Myxococcales bacterium]